LYRSRLRSKKYYFRIFTHILDMAVINSWLLYRRAMKQRNEVQGNEVEGKDGTATDSISRVISLADFKFEIADVCIRMGQHTEVKRGRPSSEIQKAIEAKKSRSRTATHPPQDVRLDKCDHWPDFSATRLHCKLPGCESQTRAKCNKCNVPLCCNTDKNCFRIYHTAP
jgi:hypothetical protein